ncbi:uncharacterized protein [Periplaneta americana]|uniref:uncharacterized protein n=1 Tax=Periplaneta americana TaxID=6978 RepID=UPI0037E754F9
MTDIRLMSREFIAEFIDLYRQHDCLWKIKSRDYSNKQKKSAAYNILVRKLKEVYPQANKETVVKKVNSLRTCFRKELKKYNASLTSGSGTEDVQKPNLWYFDKLLFLTDQEMPWQHGADNPEDTGAGSNNETEPDVLLITDEENSVDTISTDERLATSTSAQPSTTSKKKRRDRCEKVLDIIADCLQSNTPASSETAGRYASYGKHIAQELQELPPNMAIYCKKIINDAIYHAQLGNLTANCTIAGLHQPTATPMKPPADNVTRNML